MKADTLIFYEDIVVGEGLTSASYRIEREELVAFAQLWDPLPFHIDEAAGLRDFGSITAPGLYMLAVKQRLIHMLAPMAVIASLGYDEVRFLEPLRPNDVVVLRMEWVELRPSNSKPDRGLLKLRFSLLNQSGNTVMSHLDSVLIRRRLA